MKVDLEEINRYPLFVVSGKGELLTGGHFLFLLCLFACLFDRRLGGCRRRQDGYQLFRCRWHWRCRLRSRCGRRRRGFRLHLCHDRRHRRVLRACRRHDRFGLCCCGFLGFLLLPDYARDHAGLLGRFGHYDVEPVGGGFDPVGEEPVRGRVEHNPDTVAAAGRAHPGHRCADVDVADGAGHLEALEIHVHPRRPVRLDVLGQLRLLVGLHRAVGQQHDPGFARQVVHLDLLEDGGGRGRCILVDHGFGPARHRRRLQGSSGRSHRGRPCRCFSRFGRGGLRGRRGCLLGRGRGLQLGETDYQVVGFTVDLVAVVVVQEYLETDDGRLLVFEHLAVHQRHRPVGKVERQGDAVVYRRLGDIDHHPERIEEFVHGIGGSGVAADAEDEFLRGLLPLYRPDGVGRFPGGVLGRACCGGIRPGSLGNRAEGDGARCPADRGQHKGASHENKRTGSFHAKGSHYFPPSFLITISTVLYFFLLVME